MSTPEENPVEDQTAIEDNSPPPPPEGHNTDAGDDYADVPAGEDIPGDDLDDDDGTDDADPAS